MPFSYSRLQYVARENIEDIAKAKELKRNYTKARKTSKLNTVLSSIEKHIMDR